MKNNKPTFICDSRRASSLIDVVISIGIIVILFGGIYLVYISIINSISSIELRSAAAAVLNQQVEAIRNLPYDSVGTVGGIPAGLIPQQKTVAFGDYSFVISTVVRSIDDAFDGKLGGSPNDTAPADYKLVELTATCPLCQRFTPMVFTTTVAPANLESAGLSGSLFINVRDSNGAGVPLATVRVINSNVSPTIDLIDTTNNSGTLQLVGVPTSTQSYQIYVSKNGYSSDKTYQVGAVANPNPLVPHATVTQQQLTSVTLYSDKTSNLTVLTSDDLCQATPSESFSMTGAKLIGTGPDVLKFSTTTATDLSGQKIFPALEWDTYSFTVNDGARNMVGTIPIAPLVVNAGTTSTVRFVMQAAANPALLVGVKAAGTGAPISDASVRISSGSVSSTRMTGHRSLLATNWSGNSYSSESGGIDSESIPGSLVLAFNASSSGYSTSTQWLVSNSFDVGSSTASYYGISWNPAVQPAQSGSDSVKFQIAANNDNATWNFVGPGGSNSSYFTASSASFGSLFNGNRYVRYKIYLTTNDPSYSPRVNDVSIEFAGPCTPPAYALFTGLATGSYLVDVTAPGYTETTSSVSVSSGFQQTMITMP